MEKKNRAVSSAGESRGLSDPGGLLGGGISTVARGREGTRSDRR